MKNNTKPSGQPFFERVARYLVWAGGASLIVMSFVITFEALIRKFLNKSLGGVDEITSYVFAVTATLGFAYAVFQRANIRIDVLRNRFGKKMRIFLDVLALVCFIAVFSIISYRALELAVTSYVTGARSISPLQTLLFIPQSFWAFGLIFTTIAAIVIGWRSLRHYRKGEFKEAANLIAPSDEIERELHEVLTQKGGAE